MCLLQLLHQTFKCIEILVADSSGRLRVAAKPKTKQAAALPKMRWLKFLFIKVFIRYGIKLV
jgi:hypothetical protein